MNNLIEDEIVSIEVMDDVETMDIEVDGDHLFMANDILTHNSAYDPKENVTLANMSESIKKVEHSDFVGIIKNLQQEVDPNQDIRIEASDGDFRIIIGKNRSGPKNKIINLKSNFSHFRIDDNSRSSTILMPETHQIEASIL